MIWHKVFFKLGVYFDVLVRINDTFLESSHPIDTYIDVVYKLFIP